MVCLQRGHTCNLHRGRAAPNIQAHGFLFNDIRWGGGSIYCTKGSVTKEATEEHTGVHVCAHLLVKRLTASGLMRCRLEVTINTPCHLNNTHMILLAVCCVLKFTSEKKHVDILVSWCCLSVLSMRFTSYYCYNPRHAQNHEGRIEMRSNTAGETLQMMNKLFWQCAAHKNHIYVCWSL